MSCDYLLRDEIEEPDALRPAAPGETHLDEPGWARSAHVLSLCTCAIGLLIAFGGWFRWQTVLPLISGLIVELLGVALFELAVPRMGERRGIARLNFYMAACWLVLPIPMWVLCQWFDFFVMPIPTLYWTAAALSCYLLVGALVTSVLFVLRRCRIAKK